jgi:hypothetical protein
MKLSTQVILEVLDQIDTEKIATGLQQKLSDSFENISVDQVDVLEDGSIAVVFTDGEEALEVLFAVEEDGPVAILGYSEDSEEYDELDLPTAKTIDIGDGIKSVDLIDLSWLDEFTLEDILVGEDNLDSSLDDVEERFTVVVRGGKKLKKKLKRIKRKKRLSSKRRMALRRGAKKRKRKAAQIARKRKKSLKLRKRLKVKKKPKGYRI